MKLKDERFLSYLRDFLTIYLTRQKCSKYSKVGSLRTESCQRTVCQEA